MSVAGAPSRALALAAVLALVGWVAPAASAAAPGARGGIPVPEGAFAEGAFDAGQARLQARLLVHPDDAPPGVVRVGVLLEPAPGWHFYARDPGESGLPTELHFEVRGGTLGEVAWPEPTVFEEKEGGFTTYGYERPVLLAAALRPSGDASRVSVVVDALLCRVRCVPAHVTLRRTLGPGPAGPAAADRVRDLFARAAPPPAPATPASRAGLVAVLALAVLGGLLLNAMPCVLPVLAIKVFAVAELARRDRRQVLAHGLAYALGILLSMLALAGVVVALRAAGAAVGWGFQFQQPLYLAAVAVLLVLFAANLFGAFEVGAPTGRLAQLGQTAVGARRSFFEGLLAVALATPCSAPFLGTAVGFAFAASAPVVVAVFLCVGVGLAAPFALVSLAPGAARVVPRSGPWMVTLRRALGFALLASVVWLLWILGRTAGADTLAAVLVVLWAVAAGAFAYGRLQSWRPGWARAAAVLGAAALAAGAIDVVGLQPAPPAASAGVPGEGEGPLDAQAWTPGATAELLADGRPVFVYFTADWCLTCKVNERAVLADARVRRTLERLGVAVLRGDWTRRDEAIRAELARYGRAGVPVYLVFAPDAPDRPAVLPELLTVNRLLHSLESAAAGAAVSGVTRSSGGPAMKAIGRTRRSA